MNITTVNLSDGQLKTLRELGVENVSSLMRTLVTAHIKRLRGSNQEYVRKHDEAVERLQEARVEWYEVELARAREAKDEAEIKYYVKALERVRK